MLNEYGFVRLCSTDSFKFPTPGKLEISLAFCILLNVSLTLLD